MSHAEKTNAQVFAVVPAPVVIALPFAIVSLRSIYLFIQLFLHPVPTRGQNKNCSELYAKAERNMNITPPVGFVPASEAF